MKSDQVQKLEDLSHLLENRGLKRLLAWRDDRSPGQIGGAKARNLRWQLAAAKDSGCDTLLITARSGSNLVMAASLMAPRCGFRVCCVLRPQPDSFPARRNLGIAVSAGTEIIPVTLDVSLHPEAPKMLELRATLERAGRRIYCLGFSGGKTEAGLAHLHAFNELSDTLKALDIDPPEAIYMAAASFASGAGVACGIAQHGWPTRLVLVNVAQDEPPRRSKILSAAKALIDHAAGTMQFASEPEVEIRHCLAPEFGLISEHDTRLLESFMDGLTLDPSYTGKAFAALLRDAYAGYVEDALFWHSGVANSSCTAGTEPVVPEDLAARLLLRPLGEKRAGS